MALNLGVMSAAVTLDDSEYRRRMSGLEGASENTFRRIATLAAGYLSARALFGFISGAMSEFSKLEEGNNKLKYTYTELGEEAASVARQIVNTYNVASSTATNAISNIGDMLTGLGLSQSDALRFAEQITKRGIDVASFKGMDQTEVIRRMTVALTGETESLKTMGVVIRQGSDEFKEQVNSIMASTGATESAAKAQVILQEIMRQTKNAEGDYLRPDAPRTYAQELTDLKEAMKQFRTEVGKQVQPITQDMVVKARELLQWYNQLAPATRSVVNSAAAAVAGITILSRTKIGKELMTMKGSSAQDREAAEIKAREEVKRAEVEMTAAKMEEDLARQDVALAKNAIAVAENAAEHARAALTEAQSKGDPAAIAAAETNLLQAERNVTKAKLDAAKAQENLNQKTIAAKTATEKYAKLSADLPKVLHSIAMAQTVLGTATLFTAKGFKAAAAAVTTFFSSIGPIGWAIVAIAAALVAVQYSLSRETAELEKNTNAAKIAVDNAKELSRAHEERRREENAAMSRLEELSKYERLNNNEMDEADALIKKLSKSHKNLGVELDRNTEKINAQADAWANWSKEQQKRKLDDLDREIQAQAKSNELELGAANDRLSGEKSSQGYWASHYLEKAIKLNPGSIARIKNLKALFDIFSNASDEKNYNVDKAREIQKLIKAEEELLRTRRERADTERGFDAANQAKQAQISKELRDAADKNQELKLSIEFDEADAAKKAEILQKKINKIFEDGQYKRKGKFKSADELVAADPLKLNKKELKDQKKIIEAQKELNSLKRDSQKYTRQSNREYSKFEKERAKSLENKEFERKLKNLDKLGDIKQVESLLKNRLENAQKMADASKAAYLEFSKTSEADGVLTAAEREKRKELFDDMKSAFSDVDKWRDRVRDQEEKTKAVGRTTGSFSAAVLAAQLGGDSPEKETAANTRELVRLAKQSQFNDDDNGISITG